MRRKCVVAHVTEPLQRKGVTEAKLNSLTFLACASKGTVPHTNLMRYRRPGTSPLTKATNQNSHK